MKRFSAFLVALLMTAGLLSVGVAGSASAATKDPYATKTATWTCFLKKCSEFKQWYNTLPTATPKMAYDRQVATAQTLVVAVYGSGLTSTPGAKAAMNSIAKADPRCVAKVALDDAYKMAKDKNGSIDLMVKITKAVIKYALPGGKITAKTVGKIYDQAVASVGSQVKKGVSVQRAQNGINMVSAMCG